MTIPLGIQQTAGLDATPDSNGEYHLFVVASQWEFKVYDMVEAAADGVNLTSADVTTRSLYVFDGDIELAKAAVLTLVVVSSDIEHGLQLENTGSGEDITVILTRPLDGNEFGTAVTATTRLPDDDVELEMVCHVFCGIGHEEMKRTITVGDPLPVQMILMIGGGVLAGIVVLFAGMRLLPRLGSIWESLRSEDEEFEVTDEQLAKFSAIMQRSTSLKVAQVAEIFDTSEATILNMLYGLPEEFEFEVDQDVITFHSGITDQIDDLFDEFKKFAGEKGRKLE